MPVAISATRPRVEAMRLDEVEVIARPRHRDVQQPPLLVDLLLAPRRHVRRDGAVHHVQNVDDIPFLALGRMDRRENEIVLVDEGITGEITERFGWIQREIAEESLSRGMMLREALEGL